MRKFKLFLYLFFYVCLIAYIFSPKIEKKPVTAISMIFVAAFIVILTLLERKKRT